MQQSNAVEDWLSRGFPLAIFIAPFVLIPSLSEFANLPQAAWLQVTTFLFLSIFLVNKLRSKNNITLLISPLFLPITALLVWCFVGLSYAINPYEVIKKLLHLVAAAAAFFLVVQLFNSQDRAKKLLWAIILSGLGVSLIGICQHLFGLSLIPQIAPPAATFANKNMAAHFVVMTIPAGLMLFFWEKDRFAYLLPIMIALQTTYLAYARTRASWLALFVIFCLLTLYFFRFWGKNSYLVISSRQKKGIILGLILLFCMAGLSKQGSFSGYKNIVARVESSQAYVKEPGKQVRFAYWLNTFVMAKDHLMAGVGLGNFKTHYPLYHDVLLTDHSFTVEQQAVDCHNDLLQILAELGLVGFALFTWLSLKSLGLIISGLQIEKGDQHILSSFAAIGLASILVISFFSFPMACSLPPMVAALYLGMLASNFSSLKSISLTGPKTFVYCVIACSIFLFASSFNYKELRADFSLAKFINLESERKWEEAILVGQEMVKKQPLRHQLISYLGRAHMNSGALPQAEKLFQVALKSSPADINTMVNLGAVYTMSEKDKEAVATLENVLTIYPHHWGAHNNLGNLWMKKGEYARAQAAFRRASESAKENHLLWYNLGIAATRNSDQVAAKNAFKQALKIKPDFQEAHEKLQLLAI